MMTVDTGNSTGSAAKPNVPPAAPDAIARARCNNSDPVRGDRGRVRNATFSAASSPIVVADAIALEAKGKSVSDKLHGLADQVGKPGGKAGMFERLDRFREGFAVSGC